MCDEVASILDSLKIDRVIGVAHDWYKLALDADLEV